MRYKEGLASGFAVQYRNKDKRVIFVAFTGSGDKQGKALKEFKELKDFYHATIDQKSYFRKLQPFINGIIATAKKRKCHIVFTGHSLGGAMVQHTLHNYGTQLQELENTHQIKTYAVVFATCGLIMKKRKIKKIVFNRVNSLYILGDVAQKVGVHNFAYVNRIYREDLDAKMLKESAHGVKKHSLEQIRKSLEHIKKRLQEVKSRKINFEYLQTFLANNQTKFVIDCKENSKKVIAKIDRRYCLKDKLKNREYRHEIVFCTSDTRKVFLNPKGSICVLGDSSSEVKVFGSKGNDIVYASAEADQVYFNGQRGFGKKNSINTIVLPLRKENYALKMNKTFTGTPTYTLTRSGLSTKIRLINVQKAVFQDGFYTFGAKKKSATFTKHTFDKSYLSLGE